MRCTLGFMRLRLRYKYYGALNLDEVMINDPSVDGLTNNDLRLFAVERVFV